MTTIAVPGDVLTDGERNWPEEVAVRQQKRAAFDEFVRAHGDALIRLAYLMLAAGQLHVAGHAFVNGHHTFELSGRLGP